MNANHAYFTNTVSIAYCMKTGKQKYKRQKEIDEGVRNAIFANVRGVKAMKGECFSLSCGCAKKAVRED